MEILKIEHLKKSYLIERAFEKPSEVEAIKDLSFTLHKGKTLGLVGESGCGKSTLAKILTGLETKSAGNILFRGKELAHYSKAERIKLIQMVFQDPYQSLNPRKSAFEIIADPLFINEPNLKNSEIKERVYSTMQDVGLDQTLSHRYPHQFSGGQRQRLGIARALMLRPELLILDEPVSALDVSIQAQVLNLLVDLQRKFNLTYLFITHDLSVVSFMSDDILVMNRGLCAEYGSKENIIFNPQNEYTKLLLKSSPGAN